MTPVQTQSRPAAPAATDATDATDASGPQVRDDMTIEVALAVLAGARAGHLFLCDEDDQRTGLITRDRLIAVRDSPAYTDQVRLRDVIGVSGPCPSLMPLPAGSEQASQRRLNAPPTAWPWM